MFASNVVKKAISKWNEVEETPVFSIQRPVYAIAV